MLEKIQAKLIQKRKTLDYQLKTDSVPENPQDQWYRSSFF